MSRSWDEVTKSDQESEKKMSKGKVFVVRESVYTILLENDHLRSIYHMCMAIFLLLLLDNIFHDLQTSGRLYLGLRTIKQGFAKIHIGLAIWSLMHLPVIGLYYALQKWAQVSRNIKEKVTLKNCWNFCSIISFAKFQLTLLYVSTKTCLSYDLPFIVTLILLMETFRLLMKTYAFVRTNVPKLLGSNSRLAPISSYFYYLLAPTFIYRDSYPRTDKIRWGFVAMNLLEFVGVIFLVSFIYERYILISFQDFGVKQLPMTELVDRVFAMIVPSNLIMLSLSYLLLHCWLNFVGEVLRFGDRLFYREWWTSAGYANYHRTWNVVVQDWFFEYIYKDFYKYIFKGSRFCSSLVVFLLSALMHDYVLGFALRMFYPVMFLFLAVLGFLMSYITDKLPNAIGKVYFWFSFLVGTTLIVCLYAMEFFAKQNVSQLNHEGWIQTLTQTPVSWNFIRSAYS